MDEDRLSNMTIIARSDCGMPSKLITRVKARPTNPKAVAASSTEASSHEATVQLQEVTALRGLSVQF